MPRFFVTVFFIELGLLVISLISCLSAERGQVHRLPRGLWALIIVLIPLVGSIVYLSVGRPGAGRREAAQTWSVATRPHRTLAPDDDPEFLRNLGKARKPGEKPPADS